MLKQPGNVREFIQLAEEMAERGVGHCSVCKAPCDEYDRDGECVHEDCDGATGGGWSPEDEARFQAEMDAADAMRAADLEAHRDREAVHADLPEPDDELPW